MAQQAETGPQIEHPSAATQSTDRPVKAEEHTDHGPGIYAVPVNPYMGAFVGMPSNDLIPLTYNIPTRTNSEGVLAAGQVQQAREPQGPHRQVVVRRFHLAIHLDLFLLLKLLAVVVLFNQDGSRQRLFSLLFFAGVVYLHQTGAFAPLIRWLRQQTAPPQPRPAARAANGAPVRADNGAPIRVDNDDPIRPEDGNPRRPERHPGAENQNTPVENADGPLGNENQPEVQEQNAGNWFGIVKEIQLFVVGFITSLLPGFHPHND